MTAATSSHFFPRIDIPLDRNDFLVAANARRTENLRIGKRVTSAASVRSHRRPRVKESPVSRRPLALLTVALACAPASALPAPPANDNRAGAQSLDPLPATV